MKTTALAVGGAALGVGVVATELLYRYAMCRDQGPATLFMRQRVNMHDQKFIDARNCAAERLKRKECSCYTMINADGVELKGYYYPCGEKPCGRIAFIIHGYRATHVDNSAFLHDYYHDRGFDVFACDHVACGTSGGSVVGWGLLECRDCLQWLDVLQEKFGTDIQVILHGLSMGGASVLMMCDQSPACVKFIVDDSGYTSAEETANIFPPLFQAVRGVNLLLNGFDLADAETRSHVSRSRLPILFAHGRADPTVPFWMSEELYALCPTDKDCLFTDDARHIETMYRHPAEFQAKIDAFIGKYIKETLSEK